MSKPFKKVNPERGLFSGSRLSDALGRDGTPLSYWTHIFKIFSSGVVTLEILLALAIITLVFSAVAGLVFGSQEMAVSSQIENAALAKAEVLLGQVRAQADEDFSLANPVATTTDGIYQEAINISQQQDFFTKLATVTVAWSLADGETRSVVLPGVLTNPSGAVGGDTCDSSVSDTWAPSAPQSYKLAPGDLLPVTLPADTYPITSLDAYNGRLYIGASNTGTNTSPTLFIFDISHPGQKPNYLGSLDNSTTTITGISGLAAAGNFVYAASARNIAKTDKNFGQLQIIDVSNPAVPAIVKNFALPNVTGTGGQGAGKSIFYRQGYVYLGLTATGGNGPEFNIIDVKNFPASLPQVTASSTVGSGIKAIYVKGQTAYLATDDNTREMLALDVSNPAATPPVAGKYDGPGSTGFGFGSSLYPLGSLLYFGRSYASNAPEFNVLDVSRLDPATSTPETGFNDLGPSAALPFSLNGIIVRSRLAFLLTGSQSKGGSLQIFNVANPHGLASGSPQSILALPNGSSGVAEDCEGNYIYAASVGADNNGYLTIITGQ